MCPVALRPAWLVQASSTTRSPLGATRLAHTHTPSLHSGAAPLLRQLLPSTGGKSGRRARQGGYGERGEEGAGQGTQVEQMGGETGGEWEWRQ